MWPTVLRPRSWLESNESWQRDAGTVPSSAKRVLLVRPRSPNERFGLGPFFRVEPLGLEYLAAALERRGHEVRIVDERFSPALASVVRSFAPDVVGISCMHTVDIPTTLAAAATAKKSAPAATLVLGGHVVALYCDPFFEPDVDALCMGDGEATFPDFVERDRHGVAPRGFWVRRLPGRGRSCFEAGPAASVMTDLDEVAQPSRHLVRQFQRRYLCVHRSPVWAVETARGCPYRCSFCSTALLHNRRHGLRGIDNVCADFEAVGRNVFVVDDLFFAPSARSGDLAAALRARHVHKDWVLVQTRLDTVARNPALLEHWRPIARKFDSVLRLRGPDRFWPRRAIQGHDVGRDRGRCSRRATPRLRRDWQLRHRSRLDRIRLRGTLESRRSTQTLATRVHRAHTLARNSTFRASETPHCRRRLVQVGHAPRPLRAETRSSPILRTFRGVLAAQCPRRWARSPLGSMARRVAAVSDVDVGAGALADATNAPRGCVFGRDVSASSPGSDR